MANGNLVVVTGSSRIQPGASVTAVTDSNGVVTEKLTPVSGLEGIFIATFPSPVEGNIFVANPGCPATEGTFAIEEHGASCPVVNSVTINSMTGRVTVPGSGLTLPAVLRGPPPGNDLISTLSNGNGTQINGSARLPLTVKNRDAVIVIFNNGCSSPTTVTIQ